MPEGSDNTVEVAQRRLLEAIANVGGEHDTDTQSYIALHVARGLLNAAETVLNQPDADNRVGEVFTALALLVGAVHRERLALEAAGGVGLDG